MATLGSTATPSTGWFEQGVNTPPNIVASPLVMPSTGGLIQQIACYLRCASGTGNCYFCVWDVSGNLIAQCGPVGIGQGVTGAGAQQWYGPFNTASPVYVAGGSTIYAGFWVPEANGFITSYYGSGSSIWTTNASFPTSLAGNSNTGHGQIGAYVIYQPAVIRVWNGSAWTLVQPQVYTGSWTGASRVQVWNGSSWVDAQ